MPTTSFPITPSTNDGCGFWTGATWPPAFSADEPGDTLFCSKSVVGNYVQELTFFRWNTSSLGAGSTVTGANLKIYVITKHDSPDVYSVVGDYYDFGGEPVVAGDYIQTASPSIFTAVAISAITTGAVNTFALTDLTGISTTGTTGIRLTLSAGTPIHENGLDIAAEEHATNPAPELEVTYTVASAGAPIAWIRA